MTYPNGSLAKSRSRKTRAQRRGPPAAKLAAKILAILKASERVSQKNDAASYLERTLFEAATAGGYDGKGGGGLLGYLLLVTEKHPEALLSDEGDDDDEQP